jgi:adenine-specific DNA-methyltransferase
VGQTERLHTAAQRLAMLAVPAPDTSALELQSRHDQAFNVEEVTRQFYRDYVNVFGKLCDDIVRRNPRRQAEAETEAQLLLDRLMFLYFIQKKGWLDGQRDYLYGNFQARHGADPTGTDFYSDFLLPLFVALSNEGLALPRLGDVPFLNGGLFEVPADTPLAGQLVLGNAVFKQVFDGLLECYNFTVREDTPLDVEVAIDPEMLGQVFENLVLGLERGEDRRRATGSYYTPRVIVHFMCRQALKETLAAESGLDPARIETLMEVGPAEQLAPEEVAHLQTMITEPEARLLRGLIETLRALDPAVGSGAFLLGMLYEMVALTRLLDVRLHGPARVRRRNYDYDLKRGFIERNLYGVDIQPEAVRICELRLWLSLMVEYERGPGEAVPTLPNLSYRVRVGDSLIERLFGEPVQLDELAGDAVARQLVDRIQAEKRAYFQEPGLVEKGRRELHILGLLCELAAKLVGAKRGAVLVRMTGEVPGLFGEFGAGLLTDRQNKAKQEIEAELGRYDALMERVKGVYDRVRAIQEGSAPLEARDVGALREGLGLSFIWRLDFAEVFADKGGFDVVIANPPYVRADTQQEEYLRERQDILAADVYETLWEKWDLYVPFIERGYKLLSSRGVLQFITSDAYCHAKYARKSQEWFLENSRIIRFDFVSDLEIFEAGVHNVLFTYQRTKVPGNKPLRVRHDCRFGNVAVLPTLSQRQADYRIFRPDGLREGPMTEVETVLLEQVCYVSYGLRANSDDRKYPGEFVTADLLQDYLDAIHRSFVQGKDLVRWIPARVRFLEYDTARAPARFSRPTFPELHDVQEKLIAVRSPGRNPRTVYDDGQTLFDASCVGFVPWYALEGVRNSSIAKSARYRREKSASPPYREELENLSRQFQIKYVLAVMNSSWARAFLLTNRRSNIHLYPDDWKPLPIPFARAEQQEIVVEKVNALLAALEQHDDDKVEQLEREIDALVYELYGLTEEEIAMVEGR